MSKGNGNGKVEQIERILQGRGNLSPMPEDQKIFIKKGRVESKKNLELLRLREVETRKLFEDRQKKCL